MTHAQHAWPSDTADRIKAMRQDGATWRDVGKAFGTSHAAAYVKAIRIGVASPAKYRRFTAEDDAIIRADYLSNADLYETAKKLGRSYEVLNQRIFYKHKDIMRTVRTPTGTRAINRYGRQILELGATADEGAKVFREKINEAKRAARLAAVEAKHRRVNMLLDAMIAEIAAGKARDEAIFDARAAGVSLNKIAASFNLSRERIRQICNEEAVIRAEELVRSARRVAA